MPQDKGRIDQCFFQDRPGYDGAEGLKLIRRDALARKRGAKATKSVA